MCHTKKDIVRILSEAVDPVCYRNKKNCKLADLKKNNFVPDWQRTMAIFCKILESEIRGGLNSLLLMCLFWFGMFYGALTQQRSYNAEDTFESVNCTAAVDSHTKHMLVWIELWVPFTQAGGHYHCYAGLHCTNIGQDI